MAQALEEFYGGRTASVSHELALLWEAARDYARAAEYSLQAARQEAERSAHREVVQVARRGLDALLRLPQTAERDERELPLQVTLGLSLAFVCGLALEELKLTFARLEQLCQSVGDKPGFFAAMFGLWGHHLVRAEYAQTLDRATRFLELAENAGDPARIAVACSMLAEAYVFIGDPVAARTHSERGLSLIQSVPREAWLAFSIEDPSINLRRDLTMAKWMLGYPAQASRLVEAPAVGRAAITEVALPRPRAGEASNV